MRDRGSVVILTTLVTVALVAAIVVAARPVFVGVLDRQAAASAADAAALAGVLGGRDAADTIAQANGAVLVAWQVDGGMVTVSVRVGDQVVRARATDEP